MNLRSFCLLFVTTIFVVSCDNTGSNADTHALQAENLSVYVYENDKYACVSDSAGNLLDNDDLVFIYEGKNIRIDEGGAIIGLKSGTTTKVEVEDKSGNKGSFNIEVINREYTSTHQEAEENEGWFDSINVEKISEPNVGSNFINGMDISSSKQLYDNGARFYNFDGYEQSLFQILYDNNVNWIRLRLWNQPYDILDDGSLFQYGGGNCNLENVLWMAKEAKEAGLKIKLDFHYSDFWADPSKQVIPKEWANLTSVNDFSLAIYNYTKEVLEAMSAVDALPSMVSIGNEICDGLLLQLPGGETTSYTGNNPNYINEMRTQSSALAGKYSSNGNNTNLITYLSAASQAVRTVDENILIMIHYVNGFGNTNRHIQFYKDLASVDYDVIGLSAYPYYHFSNGLNTLINGLQLIENNFPDKYICIAETSYGFTYETDSWASNIFSSSGTASPISGYETNIQGQANLIRDVTNVVADLNKGLGVFYWEGAWTPTKFSGWADAASKASWANQALFSYNGKALGSLSTYSKMMP